MLTFNPVYLLVILPALLAWLAQARVRKVYERYGEVPNRYNVKGLEVARALLDHLGLRSVAVRETPRPPDRPLRLPGQGAPPLGEHGQR